MMIQAGDVPTLFSAFASKRRMKPILDQVPATASGDAVTRRWPAPAKDLVEQDGRPSRQHADNQPQPTRQLSLGCRGSSNRQPYDQHGVCHCYTCRMMSVA